jgi:hypothetical protein
MIRGIKRRPILVIAGLTLAFGGIAPVGVGASAAVPFRGWDSGGFSLPGTCAGGVTVDIDGAGRATHLGRYEYSALECFNPDAGTFAGVATITAADGATLSGHYAGTVAGTTDPNVISYSESFVIDGGTGRFAGASGQLAVDGLANLATGAYSQSLAGSLTSH